MHASTARFRYTGTGGSLLGLMLVNALLTVVTLGIYSFWAKSKVRRFHYAHTEVDGNAFEYHGTGGDLLRGTLRVMGIMLLLGLVFAGVLLATDGAAPSKTVELAFSIGIYAVVLLLAPVAVNLTRKYRLSRSSWRGVRFSFQGNTREFMGLILRGVLLSIVTLGWYTPWFQSQRRAFFVNNARFGSEPFMYDGHGRELFGDFAKAVLLSIPTLGLSWVWYAAAKHRYFWTHSRMRGAQFISTVSGGDLLVLHLTNLLLVVFTLGIGTPWALTRMHAFWCDNIRLVGTVDWASLEQRAATPSAVGEGLAESLDMDIDLGM